ncbi:MAG TPA: hypothetical protein VHV82_11740 [Sporichthyaceae bacterium]|jgi:hypothetical protein|nr:hypothetical protein [Sporichthyaceae bacterium]
MNPKMMNPKVMGSKVMHSDPMQDLLDRLGRTPLPVHTSRRRGFLPALSRRNALSVAIVLVPAMLTLALFRARRRRFADPQMDAGAPIDTDVTPDSTRQGIAAQRDGREPAKTPGARHH